MHLSRYILGALLGTSQSVAALHANPAPANLVLEDRAALPTSPSPTNTTFISWALTKANTIRTKYKAPALTWDAKLAAAALVKSNSCKVNHTGPYGENVYWTWFVPATYVPNFKTYTEKAFDAWVSTAEINAYKSGNLLGGGHFTQHVWKASKRIGCAWSTTRCTKNPNQDWYFTCEYDPRGNIIGYYPGNVTTTPVTARDVEEDVFELSPRDEEALAGWAIDGRSAL
ncbi:CAP domain-containing protein [Rhypophila decipiens]|uniref:CAP domain-containing protein n=1 Tax=Rhypophila decipiens TaxID=261697 RepID=A0AAN6YIC7_9PEZI|nr:CAP domain-containing protein [Rhypophila decipiens]